MAKLKGGIVGCGGIGTSKHLPSINKVGLCEVVAFCDIIEERAIDAAKKFGTPDARVYTDYKEMLKENLDVVFVCTPNRSHSEITVAALESGKHVLCEKPMAINYEEAMKMVDAQKRTGKLLSIGYQNRYRPDSLCLKELCEQDTLGEVYFAKANAIRRRAVPTWGVFLNEYEQGGGPLIDIGTHALDLTLWTMNNYKPKYAVGTTYHKLNNQTRPGNAWGDWDPEKFTVEDSAFGFVVMENGATIQVNAAWALNTLEVEEACTVLCGDKAGADMHNGKLTINGITCGSQYTMNPDFKPGGAAFFDSEGAEKPQELENRIFLNAVLGKGELCVLPEQAACVTRILEAIYTSAKTGQPVYFD